MNDNSASTFDVLEFIRAGWKRITAASLLGFAAGATYAFLAPKWYTAELTVVPTASSKSGSSAMMSGAAAALGGAVDLPIDIGGGSDVDRIAGIFQSNSVTDAVIGKFNLVSLYHAKYLEDAREDVWRHCSTKIEKKPNMVTVSCEDKVPSTAQAMVAFMADSANQVARRVSTSSASEERRFLETRVSQARVDLDTASRKLKDFKEQNKVISLPDQAKAIVTSMATLRAEMLEKQMQLAYVDGFAASDESNSGALRRQAGILQAKLKSLEEARLPANPASDPNQSGKPAPKDPRNSGGIFPPAMNIPVLQYQLEELAREEKIQETLFSLLTQRYETARVNEARDTSTFQILDSPTVPTRKTRPKRLMTALIGLFMGSGVGLLTPIAFRRQRKTAAMVTDKSPANRAATSC
jgi:uncharacterized protein involved in exopolysaccharide biosynthesis